MVKFVYAKRSIPPFFTMAMAFFVSFLGITTNSTAQTLACSYKIQLSLGTSCSDTITPSLFLNTDTTGLTNNLWIEVKNSDGVPIDTGTFLGIVGEKLAIH